MKSDIELAIIGLGKDHHTNLIDKIPNPYTLEDHSSNRYGLVRLMRDLR